MSDDKPTLLDQQIHEWEGQTFGPAAFDPERMPEIEPASFDSVGKIHAAVSPDCSFALTRDAFEGAAREVLFYIYNASAPHLLRLISDCKARGVSAIRVMYDTHDTNGNERQKLRHLNVTLKEAPSTGGRNVFSVCHQKFAVIDERTVLLGSANWAGTAIPFNPGGDFRRGNREWLVRIDDERVARWFKTLFEADWDIPEVPAPHGLAGSPAGAGDDERPAPAAAAVADFAGQPEPFARGEFPSLNPPAEVTPVISPDNYYDVVRGLIRGAGQSIYVQQQYILAGGPKVKGLLRAIRRRRDEVPGLDVRIIVSPAFRKVGAKDNWELSGESLQAHGLGDGLRAMNLEHYTHCHNKGLIIDRKKVVVSSTNWSENSVARAREAGVVIASPAVAGYYARVFDRDWDEGINPADLPMNLTRGGGPAVPAVAVDEVHPADLV